MPSPERKTRGGQPGAARGADMAEWSSSVIPMRQELYAPRVRGERPVGGGEEESDAVRDHGTR